MNNGHRVPELEQETQTQPEKSETGCPSIDTRQPDEIAIDGLTGCSSTQVLSGRASTLSNRGHDYHFQVSEIAELGIEQVRAADSPRTAGEDAAHIRALAQTEATFPPILVHRATMRVIDGMHRLRVARIRGVSRIRVCYFDGTDDEAFVVAVKSNIAHGLPLSLRDRKAAALRILRSYPHWSDRSVAIIAGISHKTVGAIRERSTGEVPQSTTRLGQDGRTRQLASENGRLRALELIKTNPNATAEQIARQAEISLTTAKDVRRRLRSGDDPIPAKLRLSRMTPSHLKSKRNSLAASEREQRAFSASTVKNLWSDPSLRFTQAGRTVLRCLDLHLRAESGWDELADKIPEHCITVMEEMAIQCADDWSRFATRIALRTRSQ